ncbi:LuxR family transcriptional regulator [Calothrix sp. NIES-3974]|nr:LuxR family transcriptional regulator [Calothrix sp. NIES-3974]
MKTFIPGTRALPKSPSKLCLKWLESHSQIISVPDILPESNLFLQVLENLQNGILIMSMEGEIIYRNNYFQSLCVKFNSDENKLVKTIWRFYQSILNTNPQKSNVAGIIEDEIPLNQDEIFRIQVRLLELDIYPISSILITIENRSESVPNLAVTESQQYQLTLCEAEVWHLYRTNHSYKNIASQLYITINTVKKHMKNIHAKRQAFITSRQYSWE